jgi:hypothetical protein
MAIIRRKVMSMTGYANPSQQSTSEQSHNQDPGRDEMTPDQILTMKTSVESSIDEFMKSVGYKDPAEKTDSEGWRHFVKGSAQGMCGVTFENNSLFFKAVAKVMDLPSDKTLILPLMRKLLELNLAIKNEAKIGIKNNIVWLAMMKPAEYMQKSDVPRSINFTMSMADYIDDFLKKQYDGTSEK